MFYYCTMFTRYCKPPLKRKPLLCYNGPTRHPKEDLLISFRPKKTGPRPSVTVREVYDKTCAVGDAVGEAAAGWPLDGRAAQRSHVLRYLGIAPAVLTPLFWRGWRRTPSAAAGS